ncbi:transglycosylase domain-containing protein [Reichenbachiella carrageenanivorans]|uniref:Transglycosylase domain-containing protein n=1 Tax=Reichenbachiella carrageenanivorans TaxID=2979869 RepID=A0ABY6D2N9_9BACT|nr:transglycosylase domain-containing protein [Reichenbachiella carrageenanivorans]UXX79353.1 transglycosylase domain-containing protein [Reichenbachiella carrageenanivorans]
MSSKKRKPSQKKKQSKTSPITHLIQWSLRFAVLGLVLFIGFFSAVHLGVFGPMPTNEDLENLINSQASEVYGSDGELIGRYFLENRSEVKLADISPDIGHALVATEDSRFYEHQGVDHQGLLRVLIKSVILGQNAGGGSTISQQLAKNVFGRKNHGWLTMPAVKAREATIANRFNEVYTKDEILELYLNTVSFGEDTYGIKTACERFFSVSPAEIKTEQAAVLIGMLKSPTAYNPRLNPERSLTRRNVVLNQMEKAGYLSSDQAKELKALPLELDYHRNISEASSAQHLTQHLRKQIDTWLADHPNEDGEPYNLETDGLKIYTTIDTRMQQYAQEAVVAHLDQLQKAFDSDLKRQGKWAAEIDATLQAGFLVSDPKNGHVLAWVGGRDYKQSQYDHILSERQVGSVFKPVVYAKALEDGYEPCDFISNRQVQYTQYDGWTPQNTNNVYDGSFSLLGGLTNSINTISVKLLMESGIEDVIAFAKNLGATSKLPEVPSIALGVANMSVQEISKMYIPFANDGWQHEQIIISRIEDANGQVLFTHLAETPKQVISSKAAHDITNMMRSVADKGTAQRLRSWYHIQEPIAAKTGTTQNHADGWFVGYTPNWLGVVWVGADDPSLHFSAIKDGQGANMALPIWSKFYQKVKADTELQKVMRTSFPFANNLADCELYREDNFLVKTFKKKTKKNKDSGLENEEVEEPQKKKRFWDLFKRKK